MRRLSSNLYIDTTPRSISDIVDTKAPRGCTLLCFPSHSPDTETKNRKLHDMESDDSVTVMDEGGMNDQMNSNMATSRSDTDQRKKTKVDRDSANNTSTSKLSLSKKSATYSKQCKNSPTTAFTASGSNKTHDVKPPAKAPTDNATSPAKKKFICKYCEKAENECPEELYGKYAKAHVIFQMKNKASKDISPSMVEKWYQDAFHTSYDYRHFLANGEKSGYEYRRRLIPECMMKQSFHKCFHILWDKQVDYMQRQMNEDLEELYGELSSASASLL